MKNLPTSAGDESLIPHPGGSYAMEQLIPCTTPVESVLQSPQALEPALHTRGHHNETCVLQLESTSFSLQVEESPCSNAELAQPISI